MSYLVILMSHVRLVWWPEALLSWQPGEGGLQWGPYSSFNFQEEKERYIMQNTQIIAWMATARMAPFFQEGLMKQDVALV